MNLYNLSLSCVEAQFNYPERRASYSRYLPYLPVGVLADIYDYLCLSENEDLTDFLFEQLSNLDTFKRLLQFPALRPRLINWSVELLNDGNPLSLQLREQFLLVFAKELNKPILPELEPLFMGELHADTSIDKHNVYNMETSPNAKNFFNLKLLDFGLRLGSFLSEIGYWTDSIKIFKSINSKLQDTQSKMDILHLDCLQRLLQAETSLWDFNSADQTFKLITHLLEKTMSDTVPKTLLIATYNHISEMFFVRHLYSQSLFWNAKAMHELDENTPGKETIDALRQASKNCVVKQDFTRAYLLIRHANKKAKDIFGVNHQKYADCLLDYGFFLLNADSPKESVKAYKAALNTRLDLFGNCNLHVAFAHEDLAYSCYVNEYNTGHFHDACEHIVTAIAILNELLSHDHIKMSTAKRVNALLLEEIAIDEMLKGCNANDLLYEAEQLHKFALVLTLDTFGEFNIQTAKHYGYMGRLYQSMNKLPEAEMMHRKSIEIKTHLLGPMDYEVAFSIGHLASLYNYQIKNYREAEKLYLRSIEICRHLFGESYSSLEYDYSGLCHVYEMLGDYGKYIQYSQMLENWQNLRNQITSYMFLEDTECDDFSLDYIKNEFSQSPALKQ